MIVFFRVSISYIGIIEIEQFLKDKYYEYRYFGDKIFKNTGNTEVFKENIYELYLRECADE